jgi:hypothetical protein
MENLKLDVIVYPGNGVYQNRLTELIQEGWFIAHIDMAKTDGNNKQFIVFELQKGCE